MSTPAPGHGETEEIQRAMRIAILALGTRGDVTLFVALARELRARGHDVVVGSSGFFEHLVRENGLDWQRVGDGDLDRLQSTLRALADIEDGETRTRQYAARWIAPQLREGSDALRGMVETADYFISNLKLVMARGGAVIPGAAVTYDPPASLAELSRTETERHGDRILDLVAMDRQLVDPESIWPPRFHFTGFWDASAHEPPIDAQLESWLEQGPKPVAVTLGSMASFDTNRLVESLSAALRITGDRCVLVGGWSSPITTSWDRSRLIVVAETPYARLLPRSRCVVHHGGYGAVVAALRAGVPSIVMPQIRAQQEFAELLARERLAAAILDTARLDPQELAFALENTRDDVLREQADAWRTRMLDQRGLQNAVEAIEAHWSGITSQRSGLR